MSDIEPHHRKRRFSRLLVSIMGAFLPNVLFGPISVRAAQQAPINITVQMTVDEFGAPGDIINLTALPGAASGTAQLRWTAPGDDGAIGTAQGYLIKVSTNQITTALFNSASTYSPVPPWTPLPGGSAEGMNGDRVVSGLQVGVTYYFAIQAFDEYNQYGNWVSVLDNPNSNPLNFTLPSVGVLNPPTNFVGAAQSTTTIAWTWDPISNATNYNLYEFPSDILVVQTTTTLAVETGFGANTPVSRTLRAENSNGQSAPTSDVTVFTLANPVTGLSISSVSFNQISLQWSANGNPTGTDYQLERSNDGSLFSTVVVSTSLNHTDTGLTELTSYYYRVVALNGDGIAASPSLVVSTFTPLRSDLIPPNSPKGMKGSLDPTGQAFTLIWEEVTLNADGTSCADLRGYNIYRRNTLTSAPTKITPNPITITAFADVVNGQTFYYTIKAVDTTGNESEESLLADSSQSANIIFLGPDGQSTVFMPDTVNDLLRSNYNRYGVPLTIRLSEEPLPNTNEIVRHIKLSLVRGDTNEELSDLAFAKPQSVVGVGYNAAGGQVVRGEPLPNQEPDLSEAMATPDQLSLYWFNGVTWVKVGGTLDLLTQSVKTKSSFLGNFQLRVSAAATSLTLSQGNVYPRVFTPNSDGYNDRVYFILENPRNSSIKGEILDISGRHVANLAPPAANTGIGTTLTWDGKDDSGSVVPSGAYMYKIIGEGKTFTGTVAVAR